MRLIGVGLLAIAAVFGVYLFGHPAAVAKVQQGGAGTGPNGAFTLKDVPISRQFQFYTTPSNFQPEPASDFHWDIPISSAHALVIYAVRQIGGTFFLDLSIDGVTYPVDLPLPLVAPPGSIVRFRVYAPGGSPGLLVQGAVLDAAWL